MRTVRPEMPAKTVALIGRPNVGKSTLFNCLTRSNRAITHDRPGVTRDRMEGVVIRGEDVRFGLVDTGGVNLDESGLAGEGPDELKGFEQEVLQQATRAIEDADVLLLVVDGREGLLPIDERLSDFVRSTNKPVLAVVNKVDGGEQEDMFLSDFYAMGLELAPVSAAHGYKLHGLIDRVWQLLESVEVPEIEDEDITKSEDELDPTFGLRLALLGKPNAGKSSMINALLGEDRMIVSDIAGTTRDSVDMTLEETVKGEKKRYTFVDTAGIRKRTKIIDKVERISVSASLKSGRKADVSLFILDATEGVTLQDKKLLAYLDKEKIPFITIVNKIDLVPRKEMPALKQAYKDMLQICPHVPVLYTSALKNKGLRYILPLAEELYDECGLRVGTGLLNRVMREALDKHQPPVIKRRRAKFYYLTQADSRPPTFAFFVNDPERVKGSYARYLENQLRKRLGFKHAPLRVNFRPSHGNK